jgi:hypothetical protein
MKKVMLDEKSEKGKVMPPVNRAEARGPAPEEPPESSQFDFS